MEKNKNTLMIFGGFDKSNFIEIVENSALVTWIIFSCSGEKLYLCQPYKKVQIFDFRVFRGVA